MTDWNKDEFMSKWDKTYVSTNLKQGAQAYSKGNFLGLHSDLVSEYPELEHVAYTLIAAACCAVGRADVVGRFFDDLTINSTPEESERIFLRLKEAITIIFPYLGMPTCIPACYGMIGVVQRKGKAYGSTEVLRKPVITEEDVRKGSELRAKIYKGVGNSDIFALMDTYFTDLFTTSTVVTWGYLIAKSNEEVFKQEESHLIVATAILALGATRQTKSHLKATMGIGNTIATVKAVVNMVTKIAEWADRPPIGPFDVDQLASEIKQNLKA